ncbi:MAG: hypothetical protein FWE29_02105 [Defluviitaleaceae bacterium]|nr:hypothetical protein [Defluviitaleaceae bacterium]
MNIIYKTVIALKEDIQEDKLIRIRKLIKKQFVNNAGSVLNKKIDDSSRLEFEGEENDYWCLQVGMSQIRKTEELMDYITEINWFDDSNPGK